MHFGSSDTKLSDQLREILTIYPSNVKHNLVLQPLPQNVSNSCPQPELNKVCGYQDSVECRTNGTFRPNTVEEVQDIVKNAVAKGLRVRAVGHGHSATQIWCDNEQAVTIALDGLNKILNINLTANTIQVEAGAMLGEIHDALDAVNMALAAYYPAYRNFTISGSISTGAHGTSLDTSSALADSVISIDLVDAKGNLLTLTTDDIRLAAARTSIGVLGVIVRVTLPIMPQFKIHMQVITLPDSRMQEPDFINWIRNGTYVAFAWYPRAKVIIVEYGQKVSSTTPGDGELALFNQDPEFIKIFSDINELIIKYPELGPTIEILIADSQSKSPNYKYPDKKASVDVIGWSHNMMCGTCSTKCPWFYGIHTEEASYGLPLSAFSSIVQDITALLNSKEHHLLSFLLSGIYFRFGKPTTALLGIGRTTEWFVAEVTNWSPVDGGPIYDQAGLDEIEAIMRDKYKGVPHWGKNKNSTFTRAQNFADKYGSNWQTFWSIQKELDPTGVFVSPFISKFSN